MTPWWIWWGISEWFLECNPCPKGQRRVTNFPALSNQNKKTGPCSTSLPGWSPKIPNPMGSLHAHKHSALTSIWINSVVYSPGSQFLILGDPQTSLLKTRMYVSRPAKLNNWELSRVIALDEQSSRQGPIINIWRKVLPVLLSDV